MYNVVWECQGGVFFLKGTVWTFEIDRASKFKTEDEAKKAIDKAAQFKKKSDVKKWRIEFRE